MSAPITPLMLLAQLGDKMEALYEHVYKTDGQPFKVIRVDEQSNKTVVTVQLKDGTQRTVVL